MAEYFTITYQSKLFFMNLYINNAFMGEGMGHWVLWSISGLKVVFLALVFSFFSIQKC